MNFPPHFTKSDVRAALKVKQLHPHLSDDEIIAIVSEVIAQEGQLQTNS